MKPFILLFIVMSLGFGSVALAEDPSDGKSLDLTLRLGVILGSVELEDPATQTTTPFTYGGVPIGVGFNFDFSRWFTFSVEGHFVFDQSNAQITRTGFDFMAAFHLLGGARRTTSDYGGSATLMSRDSYNLSLLLRTGFHSYGATSQDVGDTLEGSVFENKIGAQYRYDIDSLNAISASFLITGLSLPSGLQRLTTSLIAIFVDWRFFL